MTKWQKQAIWLALALAAWWFFVGDNPAHLVNQFVGRGRKLTTSHLDDAGNLIESPQDLQAQIALALGRSVDLDAVLLARVSASEHAGAFTKEKTAIQWVCRNDAQEHGWSIQYTVTVNPGSLGVQTGRRYSTRGGGLAGEREIHEDDLQIAEDILAGRSLDITGGAAKFVHKTGFKSVAAYLGLVAKWQQDGLSPVFLGGVSSLVVFLPTSQIQSDSEGAS